MAKIWEWSIGLFECLSLKDKKAHHRILENRLRDIKRINPYLWEELQDTIADINAERGGR